MAADFRALHAHNGTLSTSFGHLGGVAFSRTDFGCLEGRGERGITAKLLRKKCCGVTEYEEGKDIKEVLKPSIPPPPPSLSLSHQT